MMLLPHFKGISLGCKYLTMLSRNQTRWHALSFHLREEWPGAQQQVRQLYGQSIKVKNTKVVFKPLQHNNTTILRNLWPDSKRKVSLHLFTFGQISTTEIIPDQLSAAPILIYPWLHRQPSLYYFSTEENMEESSFSGRSWSFLLDFSVDLLMYIHNGHLILILSHNVCHIESKSVYIMSYERRKRGDHDAYCN